jgi:hypothetical protein
VASLLLLANGIRHLVSMLHVGLVSLLLPYCMLLLQCLLKRSCFCWRRYRGGVLVAAFNPAVACLLESQMQFASLLLMEFLMLLPFDVGGWGGGGPLIFMHY